MLRALIVLSVLAVWTAPVVTAAAAKSPSAVVEQLIRDRLAAAGRGDKAAWRRHIAEDSVWVGPGLQVGTLADAEAEQIGTKELLEIRDFQAHAFGADLVIGTYLYVAHGENDGAATLRRWRKSDTYRRIGGTWKMIQAVEIVIPSRAIAKIDRKVYDDYVGTYRLKPGVELRVWRDGDRLMMQATDQGAGETYPAGNDVFFDDGEPGDYTFIRDASGKVIAIIYRNEGTELRLERVS